MSAKPSIEELFGSAPADEPGEASELGVAPIARQVLRLREDVEAAKATLRAASSQLDDAELALIRKLDEEKLTSVKLPDGTRFTACVKYQFALPNKSEEGRREAAIAWLRRVGAKDLMEIGIHASTLTAFLRDRKGAGKPISELIKTTELRWLQVAKR